MQFNDPPTERWSAIVPPQSALTFAVIWDSEGEGDIITFSGAQLAETADADYAESLGSPLDIDSSSQFSDSPQSAYAPESQRTSFFSAHSSSFPVLGTPLSERRHLGRTQTSSTLGGLDVYMKGEVLRQTHVYRRRYTCLEDFGEFEFDTRMDFATQNTEGYAVDGEEEEITDSGCDVDIENAYVRAMEPEHTKPAPSNNQRESSTWSRLDPPRTPGFNIIALPPRKTQTRRLRKRRPMSPPPSKTCRIQNYIEEGEGPCLEVPLSALFRCKPVLKCRKPRPAAAMDDGSWVWVGRG